MYFEILVKDKSGKKALEILIPKIIGSNHTYRIFAYKGIGYIPKGMNNPGDVKNKKLLNNLPGQLRAYGKAFSSCSEEDKPVVILVCDLDDKCLKEFRNELLNILNQCNPAPRTCFCIAIEEGEAWLLGDQAAIRRTYPRVKSSVIDSYINDSICGTWEKLADAVYPEGSAKLKRLGYQAIGAEKSKWTDNICPFMDVNNNNSPSFCYFREKMKDYVTKQLPENG